METAQLFWGREMSSGKDQAIAPSREVLQHVQMCLYATVFSPGDWSLRAEVPWIPLEFFHCTEP